MGVCITKSFSKFHDPILSIDLGDLEMICEKKNELLFFCEEPRSNIALLVSRIEFYFTFAPDEEAIGQLSSTILINYHVDKNPRNHVYENCVIFTKGYKITEIIIYLPTHGVHVSSRAKIPLLRKNCWILHHLL